MKLLSRLDELGITRKAFAEVAGVSERSVYDWFSYRKEPRLTLVQVSNLCDLLKWTVQEFAESYYPSDGDAAIATQIGGASPSK